MGDFRMQIMGSNGCDWQVLLRRDPEGQQSRKGSGGTMFSANIFRLKELLENDSHVWPKAKFTLVLNQAKVSLGNL
jgi:hypothetical protein